MKPDYGLRLLQDGVASNVDLFFYDFTLFSITTRDGGRGDCCQGAAVLTIPREEVAVVVAPFIIRQRQLQAAVRSRR